MAKDAIEGSPALSRHLLSHSGQPAGKQEVNLGRSSTRLRAGW
jgi:hypothetical protein